VLLGYKDEGSGCRTVGPHSLSLRTKSTASTMRTLPLVALLLLSSVSFAQKKIDITEGASAFLNGSQNAFSFIIYNADLKTVSKAWEKQLKDLKGKVSNKKEFFADNCSVKEMGANAFDVYSKVEEALGEGIRVTVAFDLGGAYMSSAAHPDKVVAAKVILYNFAVEQTREVVKTEIELAKQQLEFKEKELSLLMANEQELKRAIADYEDKIAQAKTGIEGLKALQTTKMGEVEMQKTVVKGLDDKLKSVN
jgi:hypothetical protein